MREYKNDYLNNISFPLGGIGSGSISLAGCGMLVDPEINNHPCREENCGFSGFAVRAEKDGKTVDCRLLCADRTKDLIGTIRGTYGQGCDFFAGFRHFDDAVFISEFPFARIKLSDSVFPGSAEIEAFNPFIPSNDRDSSIPAAFFNITIKNTSDDTLTYTVLQNMTNMLDDRGLNRFGENGDMKFITLCSSTDDKASVKYGNITIATDEKSVSHTDFWYRGRWFDGATMFKNDLLSPGELKNRVYDTPLDDGKRDTATLAARVTLMPGESKTLKFLITWYVPNAKCYWMYNGEVNYKNYYSVLFENSESVARYCFDNWQRLYSDTKKFAERLHSSSLPESVLSAITDNLAILKSSTCLRLEDGSFWGWEGVNRYTGSCEGSCQHVYNYAYAMAFLFPKLERGLRTNEIKSCLAENGKMTFRMPITLGQRNSGRACVDGQMGFVIKAFREWKLSGDDEWLRKNWQSIKNCLSYAWNSENHDMWDIEMSGVISGRQHHTLDVELFGVHAWLTGMYIAALSAAAEMADFLGERETAELYRKTAENGRRFIDEKTFNGEYYVQLTDIEDKEIIEKFADNESDKNLVFNANIKDMDYYWDDSIKQSKYQIENGCEIDQVLSDWHADLVGLPNSFNKEHRKSALEAIYKYNFCNMHDLLNPCRVFACNDEKGVIICSWPEGVRKPAIPIPYSEECMSGFEYAFAANMLQCGMEKEAVEIVEEIRKRYDGKRRNPFSELECGASYVRAMASYSFLLIYSGFKFDMPNKSLGFSPIKNGEYFWSADGAWGSVSIDEHKWEFTVDFGETELEHFTVNLKNIKSVKLGGTEIPFSAEENGIGIKCKLCAGDTLSIIA